MAQVKIRNAQTGQVRTVDDTELGSYGLGANPTPYQGDPLSGPTNQMTTQQANDLLNNSQKYSPSVTPQPASAVGGQPVQPVQAQVTDPSNGFSPVSDAQLSNKKSSSQPKAKGKPNALLDYIPTLGGVLGGIAGAFVPGAGETGLSEAAGAGVGQGIGKNIENLLTGRPVGENVGGEVAKGGAFTYLGGVLGKNVIGPIAGKVADAFGPEGLNLTQSVVNKLGTKIGKPVGEFLDNLGAKGLSRQTLKDTVIDPLNQAYGDIVNKSGLTVSNDVLDKNYKSAIDKLLSSPTTENKALAAKVTNEFNNFRSQTGLQTVDSTSGLVSNSDNIPASKAWGFKNAFDTATSNSQFAADPIGKSVNRTMGSILRRSINSAADEAGLTVPEGLPNSGQPLSELGNTLKGLNLIDEEAAKRIGMAPKSNPLAQYLRAGLTGAVASHFGQNPLMAGATEFGAEQAFQNPVLRSILSQGAGKVAGAAGSDMGVGIARAGGEIGGNALTNLLFNKSGQQNSSDNTDQNTTDNSHTDSIPQTPNGGLVAQVGGQIQIPKDNKGNLQFPNALPPISQISNTIPGMTYTPDQYKSDLTKIQGDVQRATASHDVVALDGLAKSKAIIDSQWALNKQVADQYVSTHQLDGSENSFMRIAPESYSQMNQLRGLINSQGGKDLFQAFLNRNESLADIKAQNNPNFGKMQALLTNLGFASARSAEGGKPSNQELNVVLGAGPQVGDTISNALGKLDTQQEKLLRTYASWAPIYGYTLSSPPPQAPQQSPLQQAGVLQQPQTQQPIQQPVQQPAAQPGQTGFNTQNYPNALLFDTLYGRNGKFGASTQ